MNISTKLLCAAGFTMLVAGCAEPRYYGEARREDSRHVPGYYSGTLPEPHYQSSAPEVRYYESRPEYSERERLAPTGVEPFRGEDYAPSRIERNDSPSIVVQRSSRGQTQDLAIADQIHHLFEKDHDLNRALRRATISVHNGRVTLSGYMRSEREARKAFERLQRVPGVVSVKQKVTLSAERY